MMQFFRPITLAFIAAAGASSSLAQEYLTIPSGPGTPRAAVYSFEDKIDIKGLRLGDPGHESLNILIELKNKYGDAFRARRMDEFFKARSTNGRHAGNYKYLDGFDINIEDPQYTESFIVKWGTEATAQHTDHIERRVKYKPCFLPDAEATIASVREKYGEPTYYTEPSFSGVISLRHVFYYTWFDNELEKPVDKDGFYGRPYKCQQYTPVPYRFESTQPYIEGCSAHLIVMVEVDKAGRATGIVQRFTSVARHREDVEKTDAAISAQLSVDTITPAAPRL